MATVAAAGIQLVRRKEGIKLVGFSLGSPQYVGSALESRLDTWQSCTEAIKSARRKRGETTTKFYLQFGDPIPTPGKGSPDDSFSRPQCWRNLACRVSQSFPRRRDIGATKDHLVQVRNSNGETCAKGGLNKSSVALSFRARFPLRFAR